MNTLIHFDISGIANTVIAGVGVAFFIWLGSFLRKYLKNRLQEAEDRAEWQANVSGWQENVILELKSINKHTELLTDSIKDHGKRLNNIEKRI